MRSTPNNLAGGADAASQIPFGEAQRRLAGRETLARFKCFITSDDGSALPLEAVLAARLAADSFGNGMALLRLRNRRQPESLDEAVSVAREHERVIIARDPHDDLGQTLSGIAYRVAAMRHGFGMSSIRARAALMKGTVTWLDTCPGTLLRCTVPFPQEIP